MITCSYFINVVSLSDNCTIYCYTISCIQRNSVHIGIRLTFSFIFHRKYERINMIDNRISSMTPWNHVIRYISSEQLRLLKSYQSLWLYIIYYTLHNYYSILFYDVALDCIYCSSTFTLSRVHFDRYSAL